LQAAEQELVSECMERIGLKVDMKKAELLRQLSEDGKFERENLGQVLTGEVARGTPKTPSVKLKKDVYARYFTPDQPAKEVQSIVEKALEMYYERMYYERHGGGLDV
jgi:ParB family chromosome partitioning protein